MISIVPAAMEQQGWIGVHDNPELFTIDRSAFVPLEMHELDTRCRGDVGELHGIRLCKAARERKGQPLPQNSDCASDKTCQPQVNAEESRFFLFSLTDKPSAPRPARILEPNAK